MTTDLYKHTTWLRVLSKSQAHRAASEALYSLLLEFTLYNKSLLKRHHQTPLLEFFLRRSAGQSLQ